MKAIQFDRTGGPEVLRHVDVAEPALSPDGLLVDVRAAGVNFIDVYFRKGVYPMPLPGIPGDEGVGIVRTVGPDVTGFAPGDRVTYIYAKSGYAEVVAVAAGMATKLPDGLSDDDGFIIAQGLTAHYLATDIGRLGPGAVALVHSAAGGVGALLTRILKLRGVRVIATVSNDAKAAAAREAGADELLVLGADDFSTRVRELTDGRGVDIAYDGIGRDTFDRSLSSVAPCGTMALYGAASGPVPPVDPQSLARAGSISLIRPRLSDYIATREAFEARIADLFKWIGDGRLKVAIGGRFPLAEAAEAHRALESRATTGKLILTTGSAA